MNHFIRLISQVDFRKSCKIDGLIGFCAGKAQIEKFRRLEEVYNRHISNLNATTVGSRIPRIIHQVWPGNDAIPEKLQRYQEKVKELHPEWEYHLWKDFDELGVDDNVIRKLVNASDNYAHKSDIIRVAALRKYGGIYLDLDVLVYRPLDNFIRHFDFFSTLQTQSLIRNCILTNKQKKYYCGISNFIIGAKPQHPILDNYLKLVREATERYKRGTTLDWGGATLRMVKGKQFVERYDYTLATTFQPWEDAFFGNHNKDNNKDIIFPCTFFNPVLSTRELQLLPGYYFAALKYFLKQRRNGFSLFKKAGEETFADHFASGKWAKDN
ncbi:MAG: glycosyltransferase family 32 protein [Candidatus Anammoxibacter sp.]